MGEYVSCEMARGKMKQKSNRKDKGRLKQKGKEGSLKPKGKKIKWGKKGKGRREGN